MYCTVLYVPHGVERAVDQRERDAESVNLRTVAPQCSWRVASTLFGGGGGGGNGVSSPHRTTGTVAVGHRAVAARSAHSSSILPRVGPPSSAGNASGAAGTGAGSAARGRSRSAGGAYQAMVELAPQPSCSSAATPRRQSSRSSPDRSPCPCRRPRREPPARGRRSLTTPMVQALGTGACLSSPSSPSFSALTATPGQCCDAPRRGVGLGADVLGAEGAVALKVLARLVALLAPRGLAVVSKLRHGGEASLGLRARALSLRAHGTKRAPKLTVASGKKTCSRSRAQKHYNLYKMTGTICTSV